MQKLYEKQNLRLNNRFKAYPATAVFRYVCVCTCLHNLIASPLRIIYRMLVFLLFLQCLSHPSVQVLCWPIQRCLHMKVPKPLPRTSMHEHYEI